MKSKKIQKRRTISMRPELYVRIREAAKIEGLPMAAYLEIAMLGVLDRSGTPVFSRRQAIKALRLDTTPAAQPAPPAPAAVEVVHDSMQTTEIMYTENDAFASGVVAF